MKRSALIMACLMSFSTFTSHAALDPNQPLAEAPPYSLFVDWAKPVKPLRIAESVWYVGTENLSSVLITTPQGHILIDGALDSSAAQIRQNIRALGFNLGDIRLILNSHARLDQAGGIAKLKARSGAKLVASQPNAEQMARGGKDDFALGDALPFPPVKTDIIVDNGDTLRVGDVTVKALLTPGHLPGSTSWLFTLADGKTMIYADSLATPGYYLVDNKNYPTLRADIERSFRTLAAQQVDIFLANKGERFDLAGKMARLAAGDKDAFIDRDGLQRYVAQSQQRFAAQLKQQTAQ
ncbi:HARLDQ motif MBL-fold protein [Atlantibacter hermannii]|uniref:HARLDQ motif MBL-fold protein n=1 Tax=Atlantibacter hermannii TaxID=565 RepID=UPI0022B7C3E3|nr:HARLDQ motif MBL-fold protein [Atlantibacter hermannii]MCZ7835660.1 HARLDQ motif MBL-fold protein [Atlantibacter hermannii]